MMMMIIEKSSRPRTEIILLFSTLRSSFSLIALVPKDDKRAQTSMLVTTAALSYSTQQEGTIQLFAAAKCHVMPS